MPDKIALYVAGKKIEHFLSYRIEADVYVADDAFRLELADPGFDIDPGMRCELVVNDRLELTGVIDRVQDGDDKNGSTLTLEGRDLMGLLVDSYVEEFPDLEEITIKALAEQLMKTVPFINRKAVRYQDGIAGASAGGTSEDAAPASMGLGCKNKHIEPGRTVFDVLKDAAMSRGAMFYALPDGTLVFGRPKAKGRAFFHITHRRDGQGNTSVSTIRIRDISRRWSKITVIGQQQGSDLLSPEEINTQAAVEDEGVPFYKPFVGVANDDDQSPPEYARMLLERQRSKGFALVYRVPGHSQDGRNWAINELCHVVDGKRRIDAVFLIYARTFELSKADGRVTEVRLGLPGMVQ